jgi:hypothetical protein
MKKSVITEPSIYQRRAIYDLYKVIFKCELPEHKKQLLLTVSFGYEKWSWRVVGITKQAIIEFANNDYKYKTRTFNRDHFYQDRNVTFSLMLKNIISFEDWWSLFWENDRTIIVTSKEHGNKHNLKLEKEIIPINWEDGYFTSNPRAGFSFTKKREGQLIKELIKEHDILF